MRVLVLAVVLTVAGLSTSSTVLADESSPIGSGGVDNGFLYAGVQYGTPPSAKNKKDGNGCVWVPAAEASTFDSKVIDTRVVRGVTQHLFLRSCPRSIQGVWVSQVPVTKLGEMSTDYLRQRLPKPSFNTAPSSTTGVVNVDMWIWTDPAKFKPISVTAWVPTQTGIAQATTTAKPTRISYSPGEPGSNIVVCNGFGEVWHSNYADDARSSCMYAYRHSSEIDPSGTFHAELNIVWSVRWTSNVATGKTLPDVVTTADAAMTVREIQALVVG